jgi:pheromone shutdown protein TraB
MFDISTISSYLIPSIVILCLLVGYIVKNAVPSDSINQYIPLIVGVLGVIAAIFTAVTTGTAITVDVIVGGLASGLASTGLFEAYKNLLNNQSA